MPPVRDGIRREVERDTVVAGYSIPSGVSGYRWTRVKSLNLNFLGGCKFKIQYMTTDLIVYILYLHTTDCKVNSTFII